LGERIGEFDHPCQVWTWRGLPYYYEHRLTAIAQAGERGFCAFRRVAARL